MKPDALPLLLVLVVLTVVVALWHRRPAKWVHSFASIGLLGTAGLLAWLMLG
jgi:hypothetical protein